MVLITDFSDRFILNCLTGKVHCNDSFGLICDSFPNGLGINIIGFRIDIRENRFGPTVESTICRGSKCQRCRNHFISRPYSGRQASAMKSRRPVAHRDRILGTCISLKASFHFINFRAACDEIRTQCRCNGRDVFLINPLSAIIDFLRADRASTINRQFLHIIFPRFKYYRFSLCFSRSIYGAGGLSSIPCCYLMYS